MNSTSGVSELWDRENIRECLMRYCRGIDRCDRQMLESAYWPDAIDDHGRFSGNASDVIPQVLDYLKLYVQTTHFLGNIFIELCGKEAVVESYFQAFHSKLDGDGVYHNHTVGGRYLDRITCRSNIWRIAHRRVIIDWYQDHEPQAELCKDSPRTRPFGGRKPNDPIYASPRRFDP